MCREARRLARQHQEAQKAFDAQQSRLDAELGSLRHREYLERSRALEQARARVEETRAALDRHFQQHPCRAATA